LSQDVLERLEGKLVHIFIVDHVEQPQISFVVFLFRSNELLLGSCKLEFHPETIFFSLRKNNHLAPLFTLTEGVLTGHHVLYALFCDVQTLRFRGKIAAHSCSHQWVLSLGGDRTCQSSRKDVNYWQISLHMVFGELELSLHQCLEIIGQFGEILVFLEGIRTCAHHLPPNHLT
jgi:hypothetical protein